MTTPCRIPLRRLGMTVADDKIEENLKYFIEIIAPFAMHLKGLPLIEQTVDGMMDKHRQLNRELKLLENYIVSPYNNERSVMDVAEWDDKNGEYKLKSDMKGLVEAWVLDVAVKNCASELLEAVR